MEMLLDRVWQRMEVLFELLTFLLNLSFLLVHSIYCFFPKYPNHYAAAGTSSSVVGQNPSIQSRDSYGMESFDRVISFCLD